MQSASTPLSRKVNSFLERIWKGVTAWNAPVQGTQRSRVSQVGSDFTALGRDYDLEITERPVRNPHKARQLVEMYEHCSTVATAIQEISDSVWSSDDGDDQGFAIAPTLDDNKTPIDPEISRILGRLIREVIGGTKLEPVAERLLMYGDAFASVAINEQTLQVERVLFLPTWEMFRVEDNKGIVQSFEQRRYLSDESPFCFHPLSIVHWRYRRKVLYGRSLFHESVSDWENLKAATEDLKEAARAVGVNPNLHIMPCTADEGYRKAYKEAYEQKKCAGVATDFYLMNGADIKKLSQNNPDLKALVDNVLLWRSALVMKSRVPPWLMGLPSEGARDIAGQPALAYARYINGVRRSIADGIRQICNLELALNGIERSRWNYRVVFPKIGTNPYEDIESNTAGIEDLD